MSGLFGDPWSPSDVAEPPLLKVGIGQAPPGSDQQLTEAQAILAHIDAVAATLQPLDSDLTAIAALATTAFGRSLLTLANAAALQSAASLVPGTDVQAHDADLDAIAALATTTFGRSLLTLANAAALQSAASLVPGTDVQAHDADLDAIAALATTSFGRNLLTLADGSALAAQIVYGSIIASGVIGYKTSLFGTVTQLTSKSTAVTLNTLCGEITMNGAQLNAASPVSFTFNNSLLVAGDLLMVNLVGGAATPANYHVAGRVTGAGVASIDVRNMGANPQSEALVVRFGVLRLEG